MINVFLVDDHEVVRRGTSELVESDDELTVVGEATSIAQAKTRIPALRPEVAVLDMRHPDGTGVELCRDLRSAFPDVNCLMLTSFTDEHAMIDSILAGAGGDVIKGIRGMDLTQAICEVASGWSRLDNRAATDLMDQLRPGPARRVGSAAPMSTRLDRRTGRHRAWTVRVPSPALTGGSVAAAGSRLATDVR